MEERPVKSFSVLDLPEDERKKVEARFWPKVEKTEGCWIWMGGIQSDGYGVFALQHHNNKQAHRVSYELLKGKIPEGLTLDHLCRNRACMNPNHLEPVTIRENLLRGNGFAARQARKSYCPRGHPLIEPNLVPNQLRKGYRICRICSNKWARDHYHSKKQGGKKS